MPKKLLTLGAQWAPVVLMLIWIATGLEGVENIISVWVMFSGLVAFVSIVLFLIITSVMAGNTPESRELVRELCQQEGQTDKQYWLGFVPRWIALALFAWYGWYWLVIAMMLVIGAVALSRRTQLRAAERALTME